MTSSLPHNRQLPLAQKYEEDIRRDQVWWIEQITSTQGRQSCRSGRNPKKRSIPNGKAPKPMSADIVVHVAICIKPNPGPGGWGATIVTKEGLTRKTGFYPGITQPLLELRALIAVVGVTGKLSGSLAIHTTARRVAEYLTNGQAEAWRANNWTKKNGDPVQHAQEWAELLDLVERCQPAIAWLESNATDEMNACTALAKRVLKESCSARPHCAPESPRTLSASAPRTRTTAS